MKTKYKAILNAWVCLMNNTIILKNQLKFNLILKSKNKNFSLKINNSNYYHLKSILISSCRCPNHKKNRMLWFELYQLGFEWLTSINLFKMPTNIYNQDWIIEIQKKSDGDSFTAFKVTFSNRISSLVFTG